MTDRGRYGRRLAALGLVPLSAGVFGGGMAWAGSHDPVAEPAPTATPTPVATSTTDPQVTAALAELADAKARIAALQATLDQRAAAAAASARTATGPTVTKPSTAKAPAVAPRAPAAAAPAPAPAPPVQTKTKAS